jgi:hypothetical protein
MNCSTLTTCIAFYHLDISFIKKSDNIKGLFLYLDKWFIEQGISPMRMSLTGRDIPKSDQTRTFKYYKDLLEKYQFQGIEDFWIGSAPANNGTDILDAQIACSLNLETQYNAFYLYFNNGILPHNWGYVNKLALDLSQWIKYDYGIAYEREIDKGPGWYVHGVIVGLNNKKDPLVKQERGNISKWLHTYGDPLRRHLGDLRDIYPLNFLSKEHLERVVGDQTLKTWIESSLDHGTLVPLTDQLWSWHVPEDKISDIREALRPTGFVLCI